jgi:hypothetical protein
MSVHAGPNVVENGLVLALDAANPRSYPGSGTTWFDRINQNNATLINGPTFSSAENGTIVFDGTNDYVDFFAANLGTTTTVEMWARVTSLNDKMFFGWLRYDVYTFNGEMGFNTAQGDIYGLSPTTTTNLGLINNWKHYVFEMRSDVSYTNNKIFVNTAQQTLSQQRASELASNRNFNSGNGRIAGWRLDNNYRMPMNLAVFNVYNRALTAAEIQQNFDATRSRFGI